MLQECYIRYVFNILSDLLEMLEKCQFINAIAGEFVLIGKNYFAALILLFMSVASPVRGSFFF